MKILKIILGVVVTLSGGGLIAISIWQIVQGQFAWLAFIIAGLGIVLAGVILMTHKNTRDFWEALRDIFGV